jgi:hypothetical protein
MGRIISIELISCKHFSGPAQLAGPHGDLEGLRADFQPENSCIYLQSIAVDLLKSSWFSRFRG